MALKPDVVREVAEAAAKLSAEAAHLWSRVSRFLKHNSALAISWSPATKTFTATNATDVCTSNGHGLADGQKARVTNSGGALPAPLAADTDYWLRDVTANTFKLAATKGGNAVDLTGDGSGTQTLHPVPGYISLDADFNLASLNYTGQQVSNAIGSLIEFDKLMLNAIPAQGDHLANLNQLARPLGQ